MPSIVIFFIVMGFVAALLLLFHYKIHKSYEYKCLTCNATVTPKFIKSLFALNFGDTRVMKCPFCGELKAMKAMKKQSLGK